jgi:tRNA A37 threonylcarbamoyladenosine dehydratase
MSIYDRQESLLLNNKQSILVCGCGGVGYWVAKFAAMSGIETLYLYDNDVFEEHNLNRIDLPTGVIGKNKAHVTKLVINELRPLTSVYSFPYKLSETNVMKADWFIDCTDILKTQLTNQDIAKSKGMKYFKVGYNGEHISLSNAVGEWGEAVDGYTIIPSWVVPASTIAALAVAKIMKYTKGEISVDIKTLLR